jgi:hypothetical protein
MDLLGALSGANLGETFSKIDLARAQQTQAEAGATLTAEQVRAARFKQAQAEQAEARLNQKIPVANVEMALSEKMPWMVKPLKDLALTSGYVDPQDGSITVRGMDEVMKKFASDPTYAKAALDGELQHRTNIVAGLQQKIQAGEFKKPEEMAAAQREIMNQNTAIMTARGHAKELMSGATPASAATYQRTANPDDLVPKSEPANAARLQGIQETNQAKREVADAKAAKAAQDQIIKQDSVLATDERNIIDNLTRVKQGKQPLVINLGGTGANLEPPTDASKNEGYVNQLQAELEAIKGKRAALQDKLHSESRAPASPAAQSARGGLEVKGNFKDQSAYAEAYKNGSVRSGDVIIIAGQKLRIP